MGENNWELPKPVFRSSSGSLPSELPGLRERAGVPTAAIDGDQEILSSLYSPPDDLADAPEIAVPPLPQRQAAEPQPYISEQFTVAEATSPITVTAKPMTQKKGGNVVAIAIVFTLLLIFTLLAIAYFLLIRQPQQTTF